MKIGKRYYWLKLKDDFFTSKQVKKLRKIAGGDTYTIIYLKLLLLAIKCDGQLEYSGLEEVFADELALDIDESPDDVRVTLNYLQSCGLAEMLTERELLLPYVVENVGSEGASAQRMREHRARKEAAKLPGFEGSKQLESATLLSLSDGGASHCDILVTERKRERKKENIICANADELHCTPTPKKGNKKKSAFVPPSVEEVSGYCKQRGNNIDPEKFIAYYETNGWYAGRSKMQNWKAAVRYWEKNGNETTPKATAKPVTYTGINSPLDCVEYPPGSGKYIHKSQIPGGV